MTIEEKEIPIASLKEAIDREIDNFFIEKIKKAPIAHREMVGHLWEYMNGGKRLRPGLFLGGYLAAGGKDIAEALKASIAVEFTHVSSLILDDVMDKADTRRGKKSMHCLYENAGEKLKLKNGETKHFGRTMAELCAFLALQYGYEIIANCNFSNRLKVEAIKRMPKLVEEMIEGQKEDIYLSLSSDYSDSDRIINMINLKTSSAIREPLLIGATLGGADRKLLKGLEKFAGHLGEAFQHYDDLIGIGAVGDKKEVGKSVTSDIEEKKKTLLIAEVFKEASSKQVEIISSIFSKRKISFADVEEIRKIIGETGSLDRVKRKIRDLLIRAKNDIRRLKIKRENKRKPLEDIFNLAAGNMKLDR